MATNFVWNELLTGDVDRAKAFLGETFGWTFEDFPLPDGPYWVAKVDGDIVAGVCHFDVGSLPDRRPTWLAFVQVNDVDATVAVARRAGARIVQEPHDVPEVGRVAVLEDPTGAPLGLLSPPASSS